MQENRTKVVFLITKSNWGENKKGFLFSPVCSKAVEQSLLNEMEQTVGGPTQLLSNSF